MYSIQTCIVEVTPLLSFLCLGGLCSAWPHPVWHNIEGVQLATDKDNVTRWLTLCGCWGEQSQAVWHAAQEPKESLVQEWAECYLEYDST